MIPLRITELNVDGFRNLRRREASPSPGGNVLLGDNGHGKTSILEAIDYAASLRSFRGATRTPAHRPRGESRGHPDAGRRPVPVAGVPPAPRPRLAGDHPRRQAPREGRGVLLRRRLRGLPPATSTWCAARRSFARRLSTASWCAPSTATARRSSPTARPSAPATRC
ncbi:MAG: AAA family ATPase [Deltaproteobacteria bacterium]|nr:AAA family ATPase [Deltaproteobacteria bacterium]